MYLGPVLTLFSVLTGAVLTELFIDVRNDGDIYIDKHSCPGEGWYKVFFNGELTEADLGFSPWGGKTCDRPSRCWGHLVGNRR